jgi:hypothetical protein
VKIREREDAPVYHTPLAADPHGEAAAPAWRGKAQSLPDGEAYYFLDWPGLIRHLETLLSSENEPFSGYTI